MEGLDIPVEIPMGNQLTKYVELNLLLPVVERLRLSPQSGFAPVHVLFTEASFKESVLSRIQGQDIAVY